MLSQLFFNMNKLHIDNQINNTLNQLTYYLSIKLDVGSENVVAIWLERPIEMIVRLIDILNLGAGYVPIDPQYPIESQQYILQETVKLILY